MTTSKINFIDNPAAKNGFACITIDCAKVLKSWKLSVYSYEWLTKDGSIKPLPELSPAEKTKRIAAEKTIAADHPIPKPILGIGIMDNIEIGTGRAELLTLIDQGHTTIPIHIPAGQEADFVPFLATPTETGNVLFYILIAVALLAALSYTIAGTSKNRVGGINQERSNLIATEILSTTNRLADAAAKLRLNGCQDTQISFETFKLNDYDNAAAPADETCHIFSINGGGLAFQQVNTQASANDQTALWHYTGDIAIDGVGTSCNTQNCAELIAFATNLNKSVCEQLNKLSSIAGTTIPAQPLIASTPFTGDYNDTDTIGNTTTSAPLFGKRAGCFENTTADRYSFYRVLSRR